MTEVEGDLREEELEKRVTAKGRKEGIGGERVGELTSGYDRSGRERSRSSSDSGREEGTRKVEIKE